MNLCFEHIFMAAHTCMMVATTILTCLLHKYLYAWLALPLWAVMFLIELANKLGLGFRLYMYAWFPSSRFDVFCLSDLRLHLKNLNLNLDFKYLDFRSIDFRYYFKFKNLKCSKSLVDLAKSKFLIF